MAISSPRPSRRWSLRLDLLQSGIGSRPKTLAESQSIVVSNLTGSFDCSGLSSENQTDQPTSQPSPTAPLWTPLPGPQTMALESDADELFWGGAAGSGKSDMLLGMALTKYRRSIIFRREYKTLRGLIDRSREIVGDQGRLNESALIWRMNNGAVLEFGAVEHEWDVSKFQGRAHALKAFDELPTFSQSQYRFLSGWARSVDPRERVRVIGVGNPPTDVNGEWVIQHWGPWLDPAHAHPAEPGELRWFAVVAGEDVEREDGEPFEWKGETITPRSRTFIPARVTDNPHLMATGYVATLQGMPEPLRSQMLYGDFTAGTQDDPWQCIPTAWVRAAQDRWTADGAAGPLTQIGFDVAQGGADNTVIARRYGTWFAQPEVIPGVATPDANINAGHVTRAMTEGGVAYIDADGIGSSTYFLAHATIGRGIQAYQGSAPTEWRDKAKVLTFVNTRAAAWWRLREALDPSNEEQIALPPDRDLRVELCAAKWEKLVTGVKLEAKKDIKKRIGRSPDLADAVVMAFWQDPMFPLLGVIGAAVSKGWGADPKQPQPTGITNGIEHWTKTGGERSNRNLGGYDDAGRRL